MRKIFLISIEVILILSLFYFVGCSKDGNSDSDNENGGSNNANTTLPDPEGTIIGNIRNDESSRNGISWGNLRLNNNPEVWIQMNSRNNIVAKNGEICHLGYISGLGNITKIPNSGYAGTVSVDPGCGYVVKIESNGKYIYARLYVISFMVSTYGGIIGAKIKYQCPFEP